MSDDFVKWANSVDPTPAGSHGWIQWKGTDVCMDIRCECGELHHFDGDFGYILGLPCGRDVLVSPHVRLLEVPESLRQKDAMEYPYTFRSVRCMDEEG